jgi:hypothetical protein
MPKKNQDNLKIIQDAVARIKRVIENDDGENPIFSQAMDINEKKWLDEFYTEASKTLKPAKKAATRPKTSDKTELSVRQN